MQIKIIITIITLCVILIISTCKTPAPAVAEFFEEPVQIPELPAVLQPVFEEVSIIEPEEEPLFISVPLPAPVPVPPQVDAASMKIGNINLNRAEIIVTINVENPNEFEIMPPTITYDYHLNRNSFIRGIIESENRLAASSVTPVVFRLFVSYSDLYRNYRQLRNSPLAEIPSFLSMTCDYDNPDFTWEIMSLELTGTLPLMR